MALPVLSALVGAASLLAGRRLYWVFVGAVGFAAAADLAANLAAVESVPLMILISVAAGVGGALLAVFVQRAAVGLAGFLVGGYGAWRLLDTSGLAVPSLFWVLVLLGAVIGVVLTLVLFEWALIFLSSLTGAGIIVQAFSLTDAAVGAAFIILSVIGIAVQASGWAKGRR